MSSTTSGWLDFLNRVVEELEAEAKREQNDYLAVAYQAEANYLRKIAGIVEKRENSTLLEQ